MVVPYRRFLALVGVCFCLLRTQPASALDFTEFGTLNFSFPSIITQQDPSSETTLGAGFGLGVSIGFKVSEQFDIEPSILYGSRNFSVTNASGPRTSYSMSLVSVPILLRYWFNQNFSTGIGAYISQGSGNIAVTPGPQAQTLGYEDLSWNRFDLGLVLSFRYRIAINELMSFILDSRLVLGIRDLDFTGRNSYSNRDLQNWMGISFIL